MKSKTLNRAFQVLTVTLVFMTYTATAQMADVIEGCAPLTVNFDAPLDLPQYYWEFDNLQTSEEENPTTLYSTPGEYTVNFRQTPMGPVLQFVVITVHAEPDLNVLPDESEGCVPFDVELSADVTKADAITTTGFNWVFGDGNSSSGTDVISHEYLAAGSYNVSLQLQTDIPTCNVTQVFSDLVEAVEAPIAGFNVSETGSCTAPLEVTFTNTTTGGFSPTFQWDFGDGSDISTETSPTHIFTAEGNYNVVLTATNSVGCFDTHEINIGIGSPVAVIDAPATACLEEDVTLEFLGASSVEWVFDNPVRLYNAGTDSYTYGHTSINGSSVIVGFMTAGAQDITLNIGSAGCLDTDVQSITINEVPVTAMTDQTDDYSCEVALDVDFTANAVVASPTYEWTFHDASTDTDNPATFSFDAEPDVGDPEYFIYEETVYDAYVIATDGVTGCHDTAFVSFTHFPVNALPVLESENFSGCAPLDLSFSEISESWVGDPITELRWLVDGGQEATGATFDHEFTVGGEYEVVLEVETARCPNTQSYAIDVSVGDTYTGADITFTATPNVVCVGETVTFDETTNLTGLDGFHYYTDDNHSFNSEMTTATIPDVDWTYQYSTGLQDVTLEVEDNGCFSAITVNDMVTVNGAVAILDYEGTCADPYDKEFTSLSLGTPDALSWSLGDGNNNATANFTHDYEPAGQGTYTVTLSAENTGSGCPADEDQVEVLVVVPVADLDAPASICEGGEVILDASASTGVGCRGYTFSFPDIDGMRPITWDQASYDFDFPDADVGDGPLTVELTITDDNGCTNTTSQEIQSYAIAVDGMIDDDEACEGQEVTLTHAVTSDATIISYEWTLSNGQSFNVANPDPFNLVAPSSGNSITVALEVEDDEGCTAQDNAVLVIDFYEPESAINLFEFGTATPLGDTDLCGPLTIDFEADDDIDHGSFLNFVWDFDNGELGTNAEESISFDDEGDYTVTLVVTEDHTGCTNTLEQNISVQLIPTASILTDVDGSPVYCNPQTVNFTNNSTDTDFSQIVDVNWDFDNGETSTGDAYTLVYEKGTYDVTLEVETSFGCADTDERTFDVVGPEGSFEIDTDLICKGESITFEHNEDLIDVDNFEWSFGDGNSASDVSPITHTYTFIPPSAQTVAFFLMTSGECEAVQEVVINFRDVEAGFTRNDGIDTSLCVQDNVFPFTSNAVSATGLTWSFGDGNTSTAIDPSHTYAEPGTYLVRQIAENDEWGCIDQIEKYVIITAPPMTQMIVETDTVCEEIGTQLAIAEPLSGSTYVWEPAEIMSLPNGSATHADPTESLTVSVTEVDANGCTASDEADLFVVNRFPFEDYEETVKLGESVTLPIEYDDDYFFTLDNLDSLSCPDCDFPVATLGDSTTFTLIVEDPFECFRDIYTLQVNVVPPAFVSMPDAFSPNGDGHNDIMFVGGRFLNELLDFRIYNRWGQVLFETNDFERGWDGKFNGVLQKPDIYVYKVRAVGDDGEMVILEGYLNLIR